MNEIVSRLRVVSTDESIWFNRAKKNSNTVLILFCVTVITLYNLPLWTHVFERIIPLSLGGIGFCVALFLWMFTLLLMLITLFSHPMIIKYTLSGVLIACASISYFNNIGVVIDENMITNILLTDATESLELLNPQLIIHMIFMGAIPCYLISKLNISPVSLKNLIIQRTFLLLSAILLTVTLSYVNLQYITYFGRENSDLKLLINPLFPVLSIKRYINQNLIAEPDFKVIGLDAQPAAIKLARTIGIVVMGETARADHFSINGYQKNTTPLLAGREIFNFSNVTSCGTSTAYSVPCIFSFLNANNYTPQKAKYQSNLLDVLEVANIKTLWRDNNSSCKGVCNRIETENLRDQEFDKNSPYYNHGEYLDEILLSDLNQRINSTDADILIVLHQLGSHGPAYHKRYPKEFNRFTPHCESNSPQNCTKEEVSNSYDNTIAYTDYFLNETIKLLEQQNPSADTFMLYVSDHGESLGENGVYLHGIPKTIAPIAQMHVPMVLWLSEGFQNHKGIDKKNLKACSGKSLSHDNVAHSLLSLFGVETKLKETSLDILNMQCQQS